MYYQLNLSFEITLFSSQLGKSDCKANLLKGRRCTPATGKTQSLALFLIEIILRVTVVCGLRGHGRWGTPKSRVKY